MTLLSMTPTMRTRRLAMKYKLLNMAESVVLFLVYTVCKFDAIRNSRLLALPLRALRMLQDKIECALYYDCSGMKEKIRQLDNGDFFRY